MIRSYFLTAIRNLWKNKLNAGINIVGLTVAFTCSILLFLMVHYELSYNQFQQNKDRLYEVYNLSHEAKGDEKVEAMGYPVAPTLKSEVPAVVRSTGILNGGGDVSYNGKELRKRISLVDPDFFAMFSFPLVAGNSKGPLDNLNNTVIDAATATALFGKENPIGRTIKEKIGGSWKDLVVAAVLQDPPTNSTIQYAVLARTELAEDFPNNKNNWFSRNHIVFVQLAPSVSQQQAEAVIRQMTHRHDPPDETSAKSRGMREDANGEYASLRLAPLASLHFDEELGGRAAVNKAYLYTLLLIAGVILVIACFNFVNLNVARSFTRAKEVGIRKTIGAARGQIFFQLWTESLLLFFVAVLLALAAAALLLQPFNTLFTEKLTLATLLQPAIIGLVLGGMLGISFLAGGYPAALVSRFKTVEVLKGKLSVKRSGLLRSGLITMQFVMACALICGTLLIYKQFEYLRTAPLGFVQESVISIPVKKTENTHKYAEQLRLQLAAQPQVLGVTASSVNIGIGEDKSVSRSVSSFDYKGKGMSSVMLNVDYDFFRVMGIQPLAGRVFSRDYPADTVSKDRNVVVTETMAKEFDVKEVAGLSMQSDTNSPGWNIVGVVPDFHLYTMNEALRPITLTLNPGGYLDYILVKVRTDNPRETMGLVQAAYHQLEPDNAVLPSWVTENTRRWYDKERRLSSVFFASAIVAIVLSCLGLFAIVSLIMEQRRKEIGVRKVLGASIGSMTGLLSKDFVRLVLLAFCIATPIAGYFLDKWLQNFAYRTELSWWIFPLGGGLTLVIALVTISVQTVRASLANPVESLRSE